MLLDRHHHPARHSSRARMKPEELSIVVFHHRFQLQGEGLGLGRTAERNHGKKGDQ
jgi:hypothetical protein